MDPRRSQRVSEALREELAEIIEYELTDPRLRTATVSEVHVTPDLRQARVLVLLSPDQRQRHEALEALEGARHYLRRELASRLRLWRIPELHFEPDTSEGSGSRIEELLRRVRRNREKNK